MKITEENIFNYIFYPESLSTELREIIKADEGLTDAVDFYSRLKSDMETETPREIKDIIARKISAYIKSNVIILHSVDSGYKRKNDYRLAAESETSLLEPQVGSRTFTDTKNEFIVRILTDKSTTKIFVFSTKNKVIENFDLIIEPHGTKYHLQNNQKPLLINHDIDIKNIRIEFN